MGAERVIPILKHDRCFLLNGDSSELDLGENTVDAIVTDPPAGIGFMGKGWDSDKGGREQWIAWLAETLAPAFRALKPGGHALVWAIPRTSHWTATALELAGFEIRDVVMHVFGNGFPKSRNVSIDIDKIVGGDRKPGELDPDQTCVYLKAGQPCQGHGESNSLSEQTIHRAPTVAGSPEAEKWEGFGTALKPACEHWILARKPLKQTLAKNVLEHGTGVLNIDGCRIGEGTGEVETRLLPAFSKGRGHDDGEYRGINGGHIGTIVRAVKDQGRWPAHLVLDETAGAMLDEQSGTAKPKKAREGKRGGSGFGLFDHEKSASGDGTWPEDPGGGASRFFYCPKPSRKERDAGLEHLPSRGGGEATGRAEGSKGLDNPRAGAGRTGGAKNFHPTVKAQALMRWLIRLITPPGGVVLDPFTGSGSTGVAALAEGMSFIGVEQSAEYVEIAKGRLTHALSERSENEREDE